MTDSADPPATPAAPASTGSPSVQKVLTIGLTGGVASGKSTVAAMFAERGARLIDTDAIAREVVAQGEPGLDAVRAVFGDGVMTPGGDLDRAALRRVVFRDTDKRRTLETLLHPLIRERTLERLAKIDGPYALIVVPLLVETDFGRLVDRVLVVDCPESLQLERLMRRDGIPRTDALAMLAAQADRPTRLQAADDVLDNSGDPQTTRRRVADLHERYLELARRLSRIN